MININFYASLHTRRSLKFHRILETIIKMKLYNPFTNFSLLLILILFSASCQGQERPNVHGANQPTEQAHTPPLLQNVKPDTDAQIAKYVVEIFEDKKGSLWFGTMSKGVARYDARLPDGQGQKLTYYTTADGLSGNTVASITEDKEGNMWFGTHSGISKYNGKKFTNFSTKEGLCHERVSKIFIDKSDNIWIGTWGGVCRFNGITFTDFPLPNPDVKVPVYQETEDWVTEIMEDKQGNIWFGRSGYSACRYDGDSFTHFTKKDGLTSDCVQTLIEDNKGNIWFGSRVAEKDHPDTSLRTGDGGLSRYDGMAIVQYPDIEGLSKNDIYTIYEDKSGNIWVGASGVGVYRYDGDTFALYKESDKSDFISNYGVQSILEDKNGTLWFGLSGGLFRFDGTSLVNVTQNGPWK